MELAKLDKQREQTEAGERAVDLSGLRAPLHLAVREKHLPCCLLLRPFTTWQQPAGVRGTGQ